QLAYGVRQIRAFISCLPAVQRALANIPVYMIFDDHEVSDDWNLNRKWRDNVERSALGRRLLTNALIAYWLCQGWGNDPARFDTSFVEKIEKYCALQWTTGGKVDGAQGRLY